MTKAEKVSYMRAIGNMADTQRFTDTVLSAFLDLAADVIFERMYPFGVPNGIESPVASPGRIGKDMGLPIDMIVFHDVDFSI